MSTGAPLNLPKPKAGTNTGQDLIEIGNSLQKINDAHSTLMGRVGELSGLRVRNAPNGVWFSLSENSSHLLLTLRTGSAEAGLYAIRVTENGSALVTNLFPSPDTHLSVETGASGVRVVSNMYTQAVSLITLS